jgi:hypothetical protein
MISPRQEKMQNGRNGKPVSSGTKWRKFPTFRKLPKYNENGDETQRNRIE